MNSWSMNQFLARNKKEELKTMENFIPIAFGVSCSVLALMGLKELFRELAVASKF